MAKGHFAIPVEVAQKIEEDPVKFVQEELPKMASRLYLDAVTAAVSAIQTYLPGFIGQHLSARTEESKAEDEFWGAWPQMQRAAHTAKALEIGRAWRQVNPRGSKDDYIKQVGALTCLALGLPLQVAPPATAVAPVLRPHAPVVTSAPRSTPAPNGQTNPWGGLGPIGGGFTPDDED